MSDIFISYSSKDKEKADQLSELLVSAGLSVWIDKKSIELSTNWSGEIADAIEQCRAFIILLSPNSADSLNVAKEVSLASHYKKKILPLDLEPVTLSRDLAYHLTGLHRAPISNIDSIIRALGKLGLEATQAPVLKLVKETDSRKSLMILPFEDFSPTADNEWFANGIVSELINALSNVKALRVMDAATTKEYKSYKGHLTVYAKEMGIRYFVQGDVRKFGDNIKITSRLLDIESGDHLWQDSMKGTMEDIFDIQERVAEKVVEGLKVHLASDEKKKLAKHGTENAEAYELYLKAREYFFRLTQEGYRLAVQLLTEALHLDHSYAQAYQYKALALVGLYKNYERDPVLLEEAETLCKEALKLRPDLFWVYNPLSAIYTLSGKIAEAEEIAQEYILKEPQNYLSHHTLGIFYYNTGQYDKAIISFGEMVRLKPDDLPGLWNLVINYDHTGDIVKCTHWASVALPYYERHLKLHPDDENKRVAYANLLFWSGRREAAHAAAISLKSLRDGASLYTIAGLFSRFGDKAEAQTTFRKAIDAGFKSMPHLRAFLSEEKDGIASLAGTPEYEELKQMVEKLSEP